MVAGYFMVHIFWCLGLVLRFCGEGWFDRGDLALWFRLLMGFCLCFVILVIVW